MKLIPSPDASLKPLAGSFAGPSTRPPGVLGPIGWLIKLLVLFGKVLYYVVRLVVWILRKVFPKR